jgi:hypothetical protein
MLRDCGEALTSDAATIVFALERSILGGPNVSNVMSYSFGFRLLNASAVLEEK